MILFDEEYFKKLKDLKENEAPEIIIVIIRKGHPIADNLNPNLVFAQKFTFLILEDELAPGEVIRKFSEPHKLQEILVPSGQRFVCLKKQINALKNFLLNSGEKQPKVIQIEHITTAEILKEFIVKSFGDKKIPQDNVAYWNN